MRDINEIRVYDPKTEGIDYSVLKAVEKINPNAAFRLIVGLFEAVQDSRLGEHLTLRDYLYAPALPRSQVHLTQNGGYFTRNPEIFAVLFMDGKHTSDYTREQYSNVSLEELAEKSGSIPFMLSRDPGRDPINFLVDQGLLEL